MLRRCVKCTPQPGSAAFHHKPVNAPGVSGTTVGQACEPGIVTTFRLTPLAIIVALSLPYPTKKLAPATEGVDTLLRMATCCAWALNTAVTDAVRLEADAARSCPAGS